MRDDSEAPLHAIKQIRKYLENHPGRESATELARFTAALAEEREFSLADLYRLNYEEFDLAIELLKDWRFDRYYAEEAKLFDGVLQSMTPPAAVLP
jgi:hypothetical protein